jgi:osmotically-inducible protein OsmY
MKWNKKGRGALSAAAACALAFSLAACDRIQSLWKSEGSVNSAAGTLTQQALKPTEAPIAATKSADTRRAVQSTEIDEDSALAAKVKSALGADPALRLLAIDTGVAGGVVTLYGTADTRAHREKAAQVASSVPGVKSVNNQLVIVAGS